MGDNYRIAVKISQLAARQHGHVTRQQLLGLGLTSQAVARRIAAGELIALHAGVYAVGYIDPSPIARAHAAVLACGPDALLSHDSAFALWCLARWQRMIEVLVPNGDRRPPGITVHRSRTLTPADATTQLGVRTTTAARTIADVAPRRTDAQLIRAISQARLDGHLPSHHLQPLLRAHARIRRLIDPDQAPTRSALEDLFVAWLQRHRLPTPILNALLPETGAIVDALYPAQRLIVELDGWRFHGDRTAFEHDRERDARHRALGYETHRLTERRLTAHEAARLDHILLSRSSAG